MKRYIYASTSTNPRYPEYNEYLREHISGVKDSWESILKPELKAHMDLYGVTEADIQQADKFIPEHDASKRKKAEYDAYCDYFYPSAGHEKDQTAFDAAWLNHIHINPHHHQHWILIRDGGELVPMEMPKHYVFEMLCDWHSFSRKNPTSTAKSWWDKNKKKMNLHSKTIKLIEKLISIFDTPLSES